MRYLFDEFELDCSKQELLRDNNLVAIEPQVFSLIVHLLENRDRIVSKEELVEVIWDGRFVSDSAVSSRIKSARKALGDNGREQKFIKTTHGRGVRFIAPDVASLNNRFVQEQEDHASSGQSDNVSQSIGFCKSADGTKIAFATAGKGPSLLMSPCCFSHLEQDWQSPCWGHLYDELLQHHQLVRYDTRGNGLSDWNTTDYSFERQLEDLEAVVDSLGVDRFPLVGFAQGCTVSAAYAAKHPDRVTKLLLLAGYTRGWRVAEDANYKQVFEAFVTLVRAGWGRHSLPFRQMFTSLFMPTAPSANQSWFNELQRIASTPENRALLFEAFGDVDVCKYLPDVKVPTLVIHSRGDMCVPVDSGRELAAGIDNARFFVLDTSNHMIPHSDPAWKKCAASINAFLAE